MRLADRRWRASASLTVLGSAGMMICLGLMLSATVIGLGQDAAALHASSITQSPIGPISPLSSATGMNVLGGT